LIHQIYPREILEELAGKTLSLIKCCFLQIIDGDNYAPLVQVMKLLANESKDEYVLKCYAESLLWRNDLFQFEPLINAVLELKRLCEMFPDNHDLSYEPRFFVTRFYCNCLARLAAIYSWNDLSKCRELVGQIHDIYYSYPVLDYAVPYAESLCNEHLGELMLSAGTLPDRCSQISDLLYTILVTHGTNATILNMYGRGLLNEILVTDLNNAVAIISKMKALFQNEKTDLSALIYAQGLQSLSLKYDDDIANREAVIQELYELQKKYPNNPEISYAFNRAVGGFKVCNVYYYFL
jgi:hypothetical protein